MNRDVWYCIYPPEMSEAISGNLKGLILVEIHFPTQRASSAKLFANVFSVGCPGVYMTFVGPDIEQALHIPIVSVLPTSVWVMNQLSGDPMVGQCHLQCLCEVAAHRCDEKGSRRSICAKSYPACKKGATSPSGNRTYVKSATRKLIGSLDLQSLHEFG
jgi:hypothetical protein